VLAIRQFDAGAGPALNELPCIALEIDGRVPWHVVPGPAAQSFWPFRATPKHFSFLAATAASTSAFVSGASAAIVARAAVTVPARTNVLTVYFADIFYPFDVGIAAWAKMHCFIRLVYGRHYTATAHGSGL
jgi:hypothetical protein